MTGTTLDLQNDLKKLLGSDNVYFQPPNNLRMEYPCIVVNRSSTKQIHADNRTYFYTKRYTLTYISYEEDPDMVDTLIKHYKMCTYERSFISDNLHHDVFILYW
jgi:hypothetical protein